MKRPKAKSPAENICKADIELLTQGNRREWEKFVRALAPVMSSVIKRTLLSNGCDLGDASDLLQELFARLCKDDFRILRKFDPERSNITTWLGFVARNLTIDHLRRCKMRRVSLESIPEPAVEDESESERMPICFDSLPARQQLIMTLLYEKEMSVREVADFLGLAEQSVRSARHKAIAKLRSSFCPHEDFRKQ